MGASGKVVKTPRYTASFRALFPDVQVHAYLKYPDTLELVYFCVPLERRGSGYGSKAYSVFEKSLPRQIKNIELFAADTGRGNTDRFWAAQGYEYKFDGEELSYEEAHMMIKRLR